MRVVQEKELVEICLSGGKELRALALTETFLLEICRLEGDEETLRAVSVMTVRQEDLLNIARDVLTSFKVNVDKIHEICTQILDIQMQTWYKYSEENKASSKQSQQFNSEPIMNTATQENKTAPAAAAAAPGFFAKYGPVIKTASWFLGGMLIGAATKTAMDRRSEAATPQLGGSGE